MDEKVLVVNRDEVFVDEAWQGINAGKEEEITNLVSKKGKFMKRGVVEEDPSYKQIIPYIVFRCGYLFMERLSDHTEKRLTDLYSFGIGGAFKRK